MSERGTTFFHDPTSEPSRAVHAFLLEAGIEVETQLVWLTRNEHRAPAFLAINPRHQVPAFRDGEFCLSEAVAIMGYLAERSGQHDRWFGSTAAVRARTAMLLSWYHTNLRLRLTLEYFLPVLLRPAYDGAAPPDAATIAALRAPVRAAFGHIEHWLGDADFLGGSEPMATDLLFAADCTTLWSDPESAAMLDGFASLSRWLARMEERPAFAISHDPWRGLALKMRVDLVQAPNSRRDRRWVAAWTERLLGSWSDGCCQTNAAGASGAA